MSDRRFLVALVALLVALLGVAMVVLALLGLRDPVQRGGEIGAPTDLSGLLTSVVALGVLLALAGGLTAVQAVRRRLRDGDDAPGSPER